MSDSSVVDAVRTAVGLISPDLEKLSRAIHDDPELRFEEHNASRLLCQFLEEEGFSVETGVAGMSTAFSAKRVFGNGSGPTIALFCEYDALEGIGHACGHNIIAGAGAGAGVAAATVLRSVHGVNATLLVIGSPGEEGGGGKVHLIDRGALEGIDAALMIHPAGSDAVRRPNLGRLSLEVSFAGRASHAASAPEEGRNALDAVTLFMVAIGLLRQQLRPSSRVHAIVLEGGDAVNVIPERTRLKVFVRSPDGAYLQERLLSAVSDCAAGAALATGTTSSIVESAPAYTPMRTNSVLADLIRDGFTQLGRSPEDSKDEVLTASSAGSTDMGNVSAVVPSAHPYIGIAPGVAGHTRDFEKAAGSEKGMQGLLDGAVILGQAVVRLAQDPGLVANAWKAFQSARSGA